MRSRGVTSTYKTTKTLVKMCVCIHAQHSGMFFRALKNILADILYWHGVVYLQATVKEKEQPCKDIPLS